MKPRPATSRTPCVTPQPQRATLDPIEPGHRPLSLALSGGGIRAALTGIGALRLLAATSQLGSVRHVSSVSGGSIAGGLLARYWSEIRNGGYTLDSLDRYVTSPLLDIVTTTSIQHELYKRAWRSLSPTHGRTDLLAERLDHHFFGGTRIEDLPGGCWFEVNSANLTTGARFRVSREIIGDYITGSLPARGSNIRLAQAVAWSCAVPGPFDATILDSLDLPCIDTAGSPRLMDGGIYDNLGSEALKTRPEMPDQFCLVVNAGSSFDPTPAIGRLPIIGDLWQSNAVLYQQVAMLRSRRLFDTFTSKAPGTLDGCVFTLRTSPPTDLRGHPADALEDFLHSNPAPSVENAGHLANYPTTLGRVESDTAHQLIHRGWWLAAMVLIAHGPNLIANTPIYDPPLV